MSPANNNISSSAYRGESAFTLLELVFAVSLFSLFAVASILAFSSFNRFATNARYETLALAVAQQRMDQVMTAPCTINSNTSLGPILTLTGTTVTPNSSNIYTSGTDNNLPLNNDQYNLTRTITQGALTTTLTGTIAAGAEDTQVLDKRVTTFEAVSGNVNLIKVTITVSYTYRGQAFSLSMASLRATDNF